MDKTKIQKVNKALIATVFATSGIAVVVPPPQKAAAATSPFKDIDQYNSHYDNILKLYKQGAIGGFPDKTFRPNQNVTRGQAAKMLATVLDLDLKNVDNPYFTDVPKSNEYYKYIAALKNAGIMSGYSNGTFMPNEVITRGQLSKMLVLGFKFEVASSFNHNFKDVNSQTSNAAYIQTLVDLKITEGTTPVTFSPYNAVTRGQIASFIVRAQDKKENVTSYKITSIEDDVVYINAVPYTVPSNLANIFNEDNEEVLKGAVIEGTLVGGQLSYVSKLTLNASGTYTNYLELNGGNGSFGASIVVNGNYIRFADVKLTGTVFINETVRPPLHMNVSTGYSPRSLGRIASTNLGFINWSNPDQPEDQPSKEDSSNGVQNWTNNNQNPGSKEEPKKDDPFVNWSKDRVVMKNVEKYVEFYNSSTPHLIVSQNATRIETNTTLPRVDIRGYVREFEIIGNITTLNLNTETDLTIYGESNIYWINKYSYTDLQLYFDGRVGTLFVDNAYGWIDIGDYTYIDRVILPKGEGPNNIFDDFLDDKDNIGIITDPDGKPVDKDDIDNQKPADKTKPIVNITNLELLSGSDISFDFTSTEVGTYYYIIREKDADPPTKSEMVNRVSSDNVAGGTGSAVVGKNTVKVSNLGEKTEYVLYVMVVDGAKNVSDLATKSFQMKDGSPPSVKSLKAVGLHGGKSAEYTFTASEAGDYYYYVRKKTTLADPTTADIVAKPTGTGKATSGELGIRDILTGLDAEEEYQLYVVMKDTSGNYSKDPAASTSFWTGELDNVQPFIPIEKQKLEMTGTNQFTVHFSEPLDKKAALKPENYVLSGTGIINISGQNEISPSKVEYKEGDTKVVLTIPSTTGLVNNDTIRVTIQPTLYDRAMNEFENSSTQEKPRNYAIYTHGDDVIPTLTTGKFESDVNYKHGLLDVNATEAGTYYYVILPVDNKLNDKTLDEQQQIMRNIMDRKLKALLPEGSNNNLVEQNVPLPLYGGFKAIEKGDSQLEIPIPNNLTEFHAWNIYIFMADRSGNLTNRVSTVEMVKDRTAPEVTRGTVIPQVGDLTAKLEFNSNEPGQVQYIVKPKGEAEPTAEEILKIGDKLEMKAGPNSELFKVPAAHKDYVIYYVAKDKAGNATKLQQEAFYSDGTNPKVEDIVVRNGDTFKITFSEAIMRGENEQSTITLTKGSPLDSLLTMNGATLSDYRFESYSPGKATTDKSELVIKFVGAPSTKVNTSFEVTMKSDVVDSVKAKHTFDLNDFGKYVYTELTGEFKESILTSNDKYAIDTTTNAQLHRSKLLNMMIDTNQTEAYLDYYYIAVGSGTTIGINDIEKVMNPALISHLAAGSGEVRTNQQRLEAKFEVMKPNYNFIESDRLYVVIKDQYGNISKVLGPAIITSPLR